MITKDKHKAKEFINDLPDDTLIEVKRFKKTRSGQQNRAMHLFFEQLAGQLNEFAEFEYKGVTGKVFVTPYTKEIVKEYIWKPLQKKMFGTDTTTKLTTEQIDLILDSLANSFHEFEIVFPSRIQNYLDCIK